MGWVKLDDGFADHSKFLEAGPLAGYLCLCAIAWSNRNLTDGFIPRAQVRRFVDFEGFAHRIWGGDLVGGGSDVEAMDLAEELVHVGLWERADGGYRIHDYLDHQRSREQIESDIEQRRRAGKSSAQRRKGNGSSNASSNGTPTTRSTTRSTEVEVEGEVKTPLSPPVASSGGRQRDRDRFAKEMRAWAIAEVPDLQPELVAGVVSRLRSANVPEVEITPDRIRARALSLAPHFREDSDAA